MPKQPALLILGVLCALIALPAFSQNLVQNGGFETGNTADWTFTAAAQGSSFNIEPQGYQSTYDAEFGATRVGYYDTLSQTLASTSGDLYEITFWLGNRQATSQADFLVKWDGNTIANIVGTKAFDFTEYAFSVKGDGHDVLSFAGYQVPSAFLLDDVSVVPSGTPVAEGGSAILYLLLAITVCGAAFVFNSRKASTLAAAA